MKPLSSGHRFDEMRELVQSSCQELPAPYPPFVLFFSVSSGNRRAEVVTVSGATFHEAWDAGFSALRQRQTDARWLRVDWVTSCEATCWDVLAERLRHTKRNYFRHGIAFDANFERACLEQELNANAVLYGGAGIEHAVLNTRNLEVFVGQRFGVGSVDLAAQAPVHVFTTGGLFSDGLEIHSLGEQSTDLGRRSLAALDAEAVTELISRSSTFLANQVDTAGRFTYGYHPCFDRQINAYNTLRHASTTYSMIEAWEVTRDPTLFESIERSIGFLTRDFIQRVKLPDGTEAAFLKDVGDEIKLGGNAVAILALTKHASVTGTLRYLTLMEQLAAGISYMQDPQTGAFVHVLHSPSLAVKESFRTIYYEGEAAFALMRLFELTGEPRWLARVEKAFEHFIREEHWRHHDHWLSYCVNELTRHRPLEIYFRFGLLNVSGYLDFVLSRITTFPTLLELMMAAREMVSRLLNTPDLVHLLDELDIRKFMKALEYRAHYLLNGHFWPEFAMYFRRPDKIVGSFFIRHHAFRVRIDDVEHYMSGFVAYLSYLRIRGEFAIAVEQHSRLPLEKGGAHWRAQDVCLATGGTFASPPSSDWEATGLCIHAPTMQPGQIVAARMTNGTKGVPASDLRKLEPRPAAILTDDPDRLSTMGVPIIQVKNTEEAILSLGGFARARMTGLVAAVTGSAGKSTTVAMMTQALSRYGSVAHNTHNANLAHGLAWNLASMSPETDYVVLEMAVGRMAMSARLAKPDLAIVTNIFPAHLTNGKTVADIARTKSAIMSCMAAGSVVVLNREMAERERFLEVAEARKLKIVHYGQGPDCDVRLLDYDAATAGVEASINGRRVFYRMRSDGLHMAMNSLAVLGAVAAIGHPIDPALNALAGYVDLPGRGALLDLQLGNCIISIIDDAYNANPGSMLAAFERLGQSRSRGRRIVVLGEMAELGGDAESYHEEIVETVLRQPIDRLYVVGSLYDRAWRKIPESRQGYNAPSLEALQRKLVNDVVDGDLLLFKGSNSARLGSIVEAFQSLSARLSYQAEVVQA